MHARFAARGGGGGGGAPRAPPGPPRRRGGGGARAPGGRPEGRSCEPKPFDTKILGDERFNLEPPYAKAPLNVVVMQ
uniref:hypothetical protein n=1 Tax=Nocardia asiatica TaxID=209252 RepID=UPI002458856D